MLKNLLPNFIYNSIKNIPLRVLTEIRLRKNKPIVVNVAGKNVFLSENGITENSNLALMCCENDIKTVIQNISNNSLYSINDQIINGYVTVFGGIRVGVAGEVVTNNNIIKTIKNISSLNIRIPHEIKGCSLKIYDYLVNGNVVYNTLIISPPGAGKTTFLRDFAYQLSIRNASRNILIVDERQELTGYYENSQKLDVGNFADVYTNCTKEFAFINGIRSMKPDVIITDEINLEKDLNAIVNAITSGVSVVCSIHAKNIEDLKNKKAFSEVLNKKLFDRYVVLESIKNPGEIAAVYNENLVCVYL